MVRLMHFKSIVPELRGANDGKELMAGESAGLTPSKRRLS